MRINLISTVLRLAALTVCAAALSACVTTGGGSGNTTTAASTPNAVGSTPTSAVNYPRSSAGMLSVEPVDYDANAMPRACVNDLRVYRAYLQMPDVSTVDLNKPIADYVRDAGGADAAINAANAQVIQLRQQLNTVVENRDPFDMDARKDADDTIATLEDGILLNQALAEALECRRSSI